MKWLLVACLLAGVVLRGIEAHGKSLWLDEFHTLFIADSDSFDEVVDKVSEDFHPPLFYWALSWVRDLDPHLQRWLPILLSLLTLIPLCSIARQGGMSRLGRLVMCGLFLFVPYQIQYGAELRAYSALQLTAVLLVWAAVTRTGSSWLRLGVFALATWVGLYVHYFAAAAVVAIGAAHLILRPPGSVSRPALIAAGTLGAALFLPWVLTVEGWIFSEPEQFLPPSERAQAEAPAPGPAAPRQPVQAPPWVEREMSKAAVVLPRTLVPMMGQLGMPFTQVIQPATWILFAAFGIVGLILAGAMAGRRRVLESRVVPCAVLAGAAGYLVILALCLGVWRDVRYQYYVVAAWVLPMVAGLGVHAIPRAALARAMSAVLLATALVAGACHALGAPREDTEGGLEVALREAAGRDAIYTSILWQPMWYPHALPWRFCAPDVDWREPVDVPPGDVAHGRRPVVVVTRKAEPVGPRFHKKLWGTVLQGRRLMRTDRVDFSTQIFYFVPITK